MNDDDIRADVARLVRAAHSPLAESEAWTGLQRWGAAAAPFLAGAYDAAPDVNARAALVHRSIPFARTSEASYRLGLHALEDKSQRVRHQACALLAYAQRREAIPALRRALDDPNGDTQEDAYAALVAIDLGNHHYFRDRDLSGQQFWVVNPEDAPPPPPPPTTAWQKAMAWLFPG